MDESKSQHLKKLMQVYTSRLRILELQAAHNGVDTTPQVQMEIDNIRHEINHLQAQLGDTPQDHISEENRIEEGNKVNDPLQIDTISDRILHSANMDNIQIFARSDSAEFSNYFEKLAGQAQRIVLIGTGINILHRDPILLDLIERTKTNCELEIYAANPYSPSIELRLIEEETGDKINLKPPLGKNGLISRLKTILEKRKQVGSPPNFTMKLFTNYPSLSLYIIDNDYFFYAYGCTLLGTFSPVIHLLKNEPQHEPMIKFLDEQYQRIKMTSVDAQLIFDLHTRTGKPIDMSKLLSLAVYLVPEATSPVYQFGSEILGYDLRQGLSLIPPWPTYVGAASDFGFHLTVADALYFAHAYDVEIVFKEIEFIAQEFRSFRLNFKIQAGFPDKHSISLVCQDESGSIEALHHEMVARCYRRAVASNYSLGIAQADRDTNSSRTQLMIQRYQAPYILQKFQPHFTLLSAVPSDKMETITQEVKKLFAQRIQKPNVNIRSLVLMSKLRENKSWQILQEIQLG